MPPMPPINTGPRLHDFRLAASVLILILLPILHRTILPFLEKRLEPFVRRTEHRFLWRLVPFVIVLALGVLLLPHIRTLWGTDQGTTIIVLYVLLLILTRTWFLALGRIVNRINAKDDPPEEP